MPLSALKFLIIRRDNIGDLVCTTPVFRALREHYPTAHICALVNSYNQPVLENNPDIDAVFAYTKAKHRPKGKSIIGVYLDRIRLLLRLRRMRFDYVILAAPGYLPRALKLARIIQPKHIVGFTQPNTSHGIDMGVAYTSPRAMHEVEDVFRLLVPLGIEQTPPLTRVVADPAEIVSVHAILNAQQWRPAPLIGIHISARKPSQRWPAASFVELITSLHSQYNATFLLFWSPGDAANPLHPGDDAKAQEILGALPEVPILGYPTHQLGQLIAALSVCDSVICSDGGAMHLAAGLGKPILCFFGKSDRNRWHPWGVPYVLVQPTSMDVTDISVADALANFAVLLQKTGSA